jgi:hypothetical protein
MTINPLNFFIMSMHEETNLTPDKKPIDKKLLVEYSTPRYKQAFLRCGISPEELLPVDFSKIV